MPWLPPEASSTTTFTPPEAAGWRPPEAGEAGGAGGAVAAAVRPPIATINPLHHFEAGSTDPESEALTNQINEHLQLRAKQMGRPLTVPEQGALAHGVIDAHQHNIRAPEQSFESINKQVAEGNSNLENFVGGMRQGTERSGARAISTMMGSAGQNLGDEAMRSAADDPVQPGKAATAGNLVAPAILNSPIMALEGPGHLARLIPEVLAGQGVVEGVGGARLAGHPIPVNQQIKQALGGAIVGGATGYAGGEVPAEIGAIGGKGLLPAAGRTVANIAAGYGMGAAGQAGSNIVNERPVVEGVNDAALGGAIQGGAFGLLHEAATRGGGASPTDTGEGGRTGPAPDDAAARSVPDNVQPLARTSAFVPPEAASDSRIADPSRHDIAPSGTETPAKTSAVGGEDIPQTVRPAQRLRHETAPELMARETDRVAPGLHNQGLEKNQSASRLTGASAPLPSDLRPVSQASEQGNAPTNPQQVVASRVLNQQRNFADITVAGQPMRATVSTSESEDGGFSVKRIKFSDPKTGMYQDVPVPPEVSNKFESSADAREAIFQHLENKYAPAPAFPPASAGQPESTLVNEAPQRPSGIRVLTRQFGDFPKDTAVEPTGNARTGLDSGVEVKLPDGSTKFLPSAWLRDPAAKKQSLPSLIKQFGRQRVEELVGAWDSNANLSEDGASIHSLADPRNQSGKGRVSTRDFMSWLGTDEGKSNFNQPAPSPSPVVPGEATPQPDTDTNRLSGGRSAGAVSLPDLAISIGELRRTRERFSDIQARSGPGIADALTRRATIGGQTSESAGQFSRNAFGGNPDPKLNVVAWQKAKDFVSLLDEYRGEAFDRQGMPASGVPRLSNAQQTALESQPWMQKAIKLWNDGPSKMIQQTRQSLGLPMSKELAKAPAIINLPGEINASGATQGNVSPSAPFAKQATGEGDYESDPLERIRRVIGAHAKAAADAQVKTEVQKIAIKPADVSDPSGRRNPAAFNAPVKGQPFTAKIGGKDVPVAVTPDLSTDTNPTHPPELYYVPKRVADELSNIRQPSDDRTNWLDKTLSGYVVAKLFVAAPRHAWRVLGSVGSRIGQTGENLTDAIPWIGNRISALRAMREMKETPMGDTMKLVLTRLGADRGSGWGVDEPTTAIGKVLKSPHEFLMNPQNGVDPLARATILNTLLRTHLGTAAMEQHAQSLAAGSSPDEIAGKIVDALEPVERLGIGRGVNGALGFLNRQTRSSTLNNITRYGFPFAGSEAGMIPDEIRRLTTGNLKPQATVAAAGRGQYGQAALSVATQLASGALGTYLAMNVLNYATTKAWGGGGRFMWDNPKGKRLGVFLAPGKSGDWYTTGVDPAFDRATRMSGVQELANEKSVSGVPGAVGRGGVNEAFSTLTPMAHFLFSAATGKQMFLNRKNELQGSPSHGASDLAPVGGHTIDALSRGKDVASGALQDVMGLTPFNVSQQQEYGSPFSAENSARRIAAKSGTPLPMSQENKDYRAEKKRNR